MKDGGPAFPQIVAEIHGQATHSSDFGMPGMSLRDWFAGQAMAAMISKPLSGSVAIEVFTATAESAYRFADAMLAERDKS